MPSRMLFHDGPLHDQTRPVTFGSGSLAAYRDGNGDVIRTNSGDRYLRAHGIIGIGNRKPLRGGVIPPPMYYMGTTSYDPHTGDKIYHYRWVEWDIEA